MRAELVDLLGEASDETVLQERADAGRADDGAHLTGRVKDAGRCSREPRIHIAHGTVIIGANVQPMPMPATNCGARKSYQAELVCAMMAMLPMPPAKSTRPTIKMYLPPIRSDIRPATGATNMETSEAGAIVRPALSAENPSTDCR